MAPGIPVCKTDLSVRKHPVNTTLAIGEDLVASGFFCSKTGGIRTVELGKMYLKARKQRSVFLCSLGSSVE